MPDKQRDQDLGHNIAISSAVTEKHTTQAKSEPVVKTRTVDNTDEKKATPPQTSDQEQINSKNTYIGELYNANETDIALNQQASSSTEVKEVTISISSPHLMPAINVNSEIISPHNDEETTDPIINEYVSLYEDNINSQAQAVVTEDEASTSQTNKKQDSESQEEMSILQTIKEAVESIVKEDTNEENSDIPSPENNVIEPIIETNLPKATSSNNANNQEENTGPTTITGTNDADIIIGTTEGEIILGLNGDDSIEGNDGNDTIEGGQHNDSLDGGEGNDLLDGGQHDDTLVGGIGADTLTGGHGNDVYIYQNLSDSNNTNTDVITDFEQGKDLIDLSELSFTGITEGSAIGLQLGYSFDNGFTIIQDSSADFVITLSGEIDLDNNDFSGLISTEPSAGNDYILGDNSKNNINGLEGSDTIIGEAGNDSLYGADGDDSIEGGVGNDRLYGQNGDDSLIGGQGVDRLYGGNGNDSLQGDDGNDRLYGQNGDDTLMGGNGIDRLYGGNHNDLINGGNGNDFLYGQNGDDSIVGEAGNDRLTGGKGSDTLTGGNGADKFDFNSLLDSTDTETDVITDFEQGSDKIDLTWLGFTDIEEGQGSGSILGYTKDGGKTTIRDDDSSFTIEIVGEMDLNKNDFAGLGVGGGKVLCTELWRQGLMDEASYKADRVFGKIVARENPYVLLGYLYWAIPLVKLMRNSRTTLTIVDFLVTPIIHEICYRIGVRSHSNRFNSWLLNCGMKICYFIGKKQRDERLMRFYKYIAGRKA